jgi:O-antigen/teichoic acid export membrane protein
LFKLSEFISFNFRYSDKFKNVIKLGIASLSVGLADQLTQLVIRSVIIKMLGVDANGLYQAIYSISMNYFSLLFISLGVYLLPVLSEMGI